MSDTSNNIPPQSTDTIQSLWRLEKIILDSLNFNDVVQKIVDTVLTELGYMNLGYRIVVLALADKEMGLLRRVSVSQTEEAKKALSVLPLPFEIMDVPLSAVNNLTVKVLNEKTPMTTTSWPDILSPPFDPDQAIMAQKAAEIKTSMVFPVISKGQALGVIIFSMIKEESQVTEQEKELIRSYADVVGLAVQNAQLYSKLEETSNELKSANEKLQELDKKKDEFVSLASHELRTPMTAIKSYLWMALAGKGGELTEKQKYYLDRSYSSTNRLIKLVNDMLNISRIESGRIFLDITEVKIKDLVDETVSEVKPRADEAGVSVVVNYNGCEETKVLVDIDKIKEVIINLVGNSIKFTPTGGKITVSTEQKDSFLTIHVADTGEGLAADDIGKLFQKFGLVKESYVTNQKAQQGTGLGLYISKSIVQLHKGTIWVESLGRGQGATFSFTVKVSNPEDLKLFADQYKGKEGLGIIRTTI